MSDTPAAPAELGELPLEPLPPGTIPDAFAKSADPNSPPPMRMMAARAMAPIPPKALVPVIYQLMMDPDPKIAAAAKKSFWGLDDKLLAPVIGEAQPPQLLDAIARTVADKFALCERVLLNKATPDDAFVWVAEHSSDEKVINVVVENQERLLRCSDIVRGLKKNPKALRSDLDRAIDFLVREGVFLDDVQEFEDSFIRLGKNDMLKALKKVKIREDLIDAETRRKAEEKGISVVEALGRDDLTEDERDELAGEGADKDPKNKKWHEMTKAERMAAAMMGGLDMALEAIKGSNRAIAVAGINNPRISEADIPRIIRNKNVCEDVIRVICNTGDWTKAYEVKHLLVQHPKTPTQLVMRWLPLLRITDLRTLSKSKQIPSQVAQQAKRLVDRQN